MSVIWSTTLPSSQLRKKHNAIAYHRVREAIAGGIIRFAKISSERNFADILTKPLPKDVFLRHVLMLLFRKPDSFEASTQDRVAAALSDHQPDGLEGAHGACAEAGPP